MQNGLLKGQWNLKDDIKYPKFEANNDNKNYTLKFEKFTIHKMIGKLRDPSKQKTKVSCILFIDRLEIPLIEITLKGSDIYSELEEAAKKNRIKSFSSFWNK